MDSSGVVRTILTLAPLPFDALSLFKIHPFKRLLYGGDPGVNSAMKSAKICPLIIVLGSKVTPTGLISVTYFMILLLAFGFSVMVLSRYSVSRTMGKD